MTDEEYKEHRRKIKIWNEQVAKILDKIEADLPSVVHSISKGHGELFVQSRYNKSYTVMTITVGLSAINISMNDECGENEWSVLLCNPLMFQEVQEIIISQLAKYDAPDERHNGMICEPPN